MLKRVLTMALVLVLILGVSAQAAEIMSLRVEPSISFAGTMATCKATIQGEKEKDKISVTMKLWKSGKCLNTWMANGTGKVSLAKPVAVVRGTTYTLTVDAVVNGVAKPTKSTTATCP